MNVLDLFSGIGGFSLGLERAGMRTVAFCEIEPFCRAVLKKHWPAIPCYDDVRTLTADRLRADGISVDVICGGFPCQDISVAGKGAGIDGSRSGLWSEYARIIGELRPRYVIVENVAALLGRGLERVLGDLAALGYDAEWHCIPASAVGAPHRRDRLWIIAWDANREQQDSFGGICSGSHADAARVCGTAGAMANTDRGGRGREAWGTTQLQTGEFVAYGRGAAMADPIGTRLERRPIFVGYLAAELATIERSRAVFSDTESIGCDQGPEDGGGCAEGMSSHERSGFAGGRWWLVEPDVGRVAHGVPARVDRLKGLGNAVVPQIPEIIGRAIMSAHPPHMETK